MDLERFTEAQEHSYAQALQEIRNGCKESHWMWFIFPQIRGLGRSPIAQHYAIQNREEAESYLVHPILGKRLIEISEALLSLEESDPGIVLGFPDDLKLCSSMTLFYLVGKNPVFKQVLDKYFGGKLDELTVEILEKEMMEES